jgi:hypothetical protein
MHQVLFYSPGGNARRLADGIRLSGLESHISAAT